MPFGPFHEYFPDVAERETRAVTLLKDADLPAGTYALVELYCNEAGCDCRRVFLCVVCPPRKDPVAVIAYGWEDRAFYAKWMKDDDPQIIQGLKGPNLNAFSPQSKWAPAALKLVSDIVLKDPAYVARIKRHYEMFRQEVEEGHGEASTRAPRSAIHRRRRIRPRRRRSR